MPINIYTVTNHLESEGWKLISDSYKNLDTELEMECPKGHKQTQTYKQWRKHPVCETCMAGDIYKVKKNKVPLKQKDTIRIVALDAATNITGYAIYDNKTLVSYGIYKAQGETAEERINDIKKWLMAAIEEWEPDFCGIENIQLQKYGNNGQYQVETYRVLANLQGVLIDTLYEKCIDHELVSVNTWRDYCGVGNGLKREEKKKQAQDKVALWYNIQCSQDEADAICIGKYFTSKIKIRTGWGEDI